MAIFLLRARHGSGYAPPSASGTQFGDVPASYWAADWIEQLAAVGITSGCGNGNYCPDSKVTRAEMAVFLVRTFNLPLVPKPSGPTIGGCPLFPADNIWNTPVDALPVHALSDAWVDTIGRSDGFHMDFGSGTWDGGPIGIPYNLADASAPKYTFDFYYPGESDPGPYPIPGGYQREWGSDCFYLQRHLDQARYLREAIRQHNVRIQQQQDDAVAAQIAKSIASLACVDHIVLIDEITGQAGISSATLRENYPALHLEVHQAIQEQRERLKSLHLEKQIEQIDTAANLLVVKGVRLTYRTILQKAGLSRYAYHAAPIRDALAHWISNLAPRD